MSKPNRTCYCCGRKYYYCPSCNDDRRDPKIYTMWDSELCKEIFNTLTDESLKKITTLECKNKLVELGVDENIILKDSVRKHIDRVMAYKEVKNDIVIENIEKQKEEIVELEKQFDVCFENTSEEALKIVDELKSQLEEVKEDFSTTELEESTENVENIKKVKRTRKSSVRNKENSEVD